MAKSVLTRDEVLKQLRKHKPELEDKFGVMTLALVADTVRKQDAEDSFIDILVTFNAPTTAESFFGTQFYIEDLLERRVCVITEKSIVEHWKPYYEAQALYV